MSSMPSIPSVPPLPSLDGEGLVAVLRAAGCVFAEEEAELLLDAAAQGADLAALVARRVAGQPLEHVVGWAEFCGLRMEVGAGVFVPRRRSEFLVREAAAGTRAGAGAVVLDLCCGVGAVGAAVAARLGGDGGGGVELHAVDIDPVAVSYAARNVAPYGGRVYAGDLYGPLPARLLGAVDVLVANAPYVPTDRIALLPPEAREHEPLATLDGGADGVAVQRRVAAGALPWLAPGGRLLIETGEHQAPRTAEALTTAGFGEVAVVSSEELEATVVIGTAAL
ncbi:release factor glutamine methyltransferase [Streptomyces sp. PvR034]